MLEYLLQVGLVKLPAGERERLGQDLGTRRETNGLAESHADPTATVATGDGNASAEGVEICVLDADDLLDDPAGMVAAFCAKVGLQYRPEMLSWEGPEERQRAERAFDKWKGFHDDAIRSTGLRAREGVSLRSVFQRVDEVVFWGAFGNTSAPPSPLVYGLTCF